MTGKRFIAAVLLSGIAILSCNAFEFDLARGPVEGLVIRTSTGVLRVEKLSLEHQRRGFFRIGLLPLAVVEDVRITVEQPAFLQRALREAQSLLARANGRVPLELRRIEITIRSEGGAIFRAGRVRFTQPGQWDLSEGVAFLSFSNELHSATAVLHLAGPHAGQVSRPGDLATFNLFTSSSTNHSTLQGMAK